MFRLEIYFHLDTYRQRSVVWQLETIHHLTKTEIISINITSSVKSKENKGVYPETVGEKTCTNRESRKRTITYPLPLEN
jgi:hypothetical protein